LVRKLLTWRKNVWVLDRLITHLYHVLEIFSGIKATFDGRGNYNLGGLSKSFSRNWHR
jgi:5'(3')-deoxyribonucleotidase